MTDKETPNHHQWPKIINVNKGILDLIAKVENDSQYNEEDLESLFFKIPIFATEKLDGTNIAKV